MPVQAQVGLRPGPAGLRRPRWRRRSPASRRPAPPGARCGRRTRPGCASMSVRKRTSSWLRVKMLGTATIIRSACSATGLPVFSQRRSSGGEDDRRCSQARNGGSAVLCGGSLTHSPLQIRCRRPALGSESGSAAAHPRGGLSCVSLASCTPILHIVIHSCAQMCRPIGERRGRSATMDQLGASGQARNDQADVEGKAKRDASNAADLRATQSRKVAGRAACRLDGSRRRSAQSPAPRRFDRLGGAPYR